VVVPSFFLPIIFPSAESLIKEKRIGTSNYTTEEVGYLSNGIIDPRSGIYFEMSR
jgi:hypothetical protein